MAGHSLSASFLLLVPLALLLLPLPSSDSTSFHLSASRQHPARGIFPFAFRQLAAKASKKKAPAPVSCQDGWTYDSRKKSCYRKLSYCKYVGDTKYSLQNYTQYQSSSGDTAFSLPSLLDAALPNDGEYVVDGLCTVIIGSSCRYIGEYPGGCHGCCYISSNGQMFHSIPCFEDPNIICDLVTLSPNSAVCGDPPTNTTICNACTPVKS